MVWRRGQRSLQAERQATKLWVGSFVGVPFFLDDPFWIGSKDKGKPNGHKTASCFVYAPPTWIIDYWKLT